MLLVRVNGGPEPFAWAAFGTLAATAVVGELFFVRWLRDRRKLEHPELLAEQQIPPVALVTHGLLATGTLVSTFVIALQA